MKQSDDNRFIPMTTVASGTGHEITPDVFYFTNQIVNIVMVGKPGGGWIVGNKQHTHGVSTISNYFGEKQLFIR